MPSCRVAICDDSPVDSGYINGLLLQWALSRNITAAADIFPSAESFLFRYEDDPGFDILLLDIEMTGMDGVTMAKKLRAVNGSIQIIFVTGYSDYIADGYDVAALHYLMKPVDPVKLFTVLDRAIEKLRQSERCLTLELPDGAVRIPLHEIRYLAVRQNYVTVHAGEDYTVRRTLGDFERELGDGFFRAGRAIIVNLRRIRRVTRTDVHLDDGSTLPLPRGIYEPLNRAIIART